MSNIKIAVNQLFLLSDYFNGADSEIIRTSLNKKNYRSCKNDYKPGSEKYLLEEAKDLENEAVVCPEMKMNYDYVIISGDSYDSDITFTQGTYEVSRKRIDYDMGEEYTETIIYKFLVKNQYWATDILTSTDELLICVKDLLFQAQESTFQRSIQETLQSMGDEFYVLLPAVIQAIKEHKKVSYYSEYEFRGKCVVIDKEVFDEKFVKKVYDAMKANVCFYDEQDRKITYYSTESYLEYYQKYSK